MQCMSLLGMFTILCSCCDWFFGHDSDSDRSSWFSHPQCGPFGRSTWNRFLGGFYYIGWDSSRLVVHVLSIHAVQEALKPEHVDKAN